MSASGGIESLLNDVKQSNDHTIAEEESVFFFSKTKSKGEILDSAKAKIRMLVAQHLETLTHKRRNGTKIDSYGIADGKKWIKDVQYFVDKVVRPLLTDEEAQAVADADLSEIANQLIERPVREECQRMAQADEFARRIHSTSRTRGPGGVIGSSSPSSSLSSLGNSTKTPISRGLIIRPEPLEKILAGRKTWEMRSRRIELRGTVALVKKGSKSIYGVADIADSIGPLSRSEMLINESKHLISIDRLDHPDVSNYRYAWVLTNVQRLESPIPYIHKGGVQFVTLDEIAVNQLMRALSSPSWR